MTKTILLSGGFDPIHIGHVRMMLAAGKYGNVIVAVNSDEWLMRKKGYIFMPFEERCEIVRSIKTVLEAIPVNDDDNTVCDAIRNIRPDYFGNGGDRTNQNTPEKQLCQELGVREVYNLGGGKIQSSSELVKNSGVE